MSWNPCPSVGRAILGALDAPDGVLLKCGLIAGHDGNHRFEMEWRDPKPESERSGLVADEIEKYLLSRSGDPDFQRRLRERIERDAEILRRLEETGE